jgi:hypothetical protein
MRLHDDARHLFHGGGDPVWIGPFLEPIHVRHYEVKQYDVRLSARDLRDRLSTV